MDRNPLWIRELQLTLDKRYLDKLDRAIGELVRLGWTCERYKVPENGQVERLSIHLNKMFSERIEDMETDHASELE